MGQIEIYGNLVFFKFYKEITLTKTLKKELFKKLQMGQKEGLLQNSKKYVVGEWYTNILINCD